MSMLAERKRKQKWSLNPRGKDWAQDANKFGQKMLEKMGWQQGKGLGAKEDGITEHVKVSYKNDSKGMGFKESNDQWTEHETNFTALLESLSGSVEKPETTKLQSLEKKSESSRVRVHYRKFTRGKDLSRYSEKDLANIFGKKSLKEPVKNVKEEAGDSNMEKLEKNSIFVVNAGSMRDYFKKKLPNFGKSNGYTVGANGVLKTEGSDSEVDVRPSFNCNSQNTDSEGSNQYVGFGFKSEVSEETPKKKKKRKVNEVEEETPKKKSKNGIDTTIKFSNGEGGLSNPAFNPLCTPVKVEKHVLTTIEETFSEDISELEESSIKTEEVDVICETKEKVVENTGKENKQKTKKKKVLGIDNTNFEEASLESIDSFQCDVNPAENPFHVHIKEKKKRKKKKDKSGVDNLVFNQACEKSTELVHQCSKNPFEVQIEEVQKKKKKEQFAIENPTFSALCEESTDISVDIHEDNYEVKRKKKKKYKVVVEHPSFNASEEILEDDCSQDNPCEVESKRKEKKSIGNSLSNEEYTGGKKKSKRKELAAMENPCFNTSVEESSSIVITEENSFEVKRKKKKPDLVSQCPPSSDSLDSLDSNQTNSFEVKKKKKKKKDKENLAIENHAFSGLMNTSRDIVETEENVSNCVEDVVENNIHEVKRKKKKSKKQKDENGIANPGLTLETSAEDISLNVKESNLMLNIVTTPIISKPQESPSGDTFSIIKVNTVKRRKSVRFSDVTQERIIPNNDDLRNLNDIENRNELFDINAQVLNSSMKDQAIGDTGLDNLAFDRQKNRIDENLDSISKTLDRYQAEIENDINEKKIEGFSMDDVMVGEVGTPHGENEKMPEGTKLKFKYAHFLASKTPIYHLDKVGPKKGYRHLIKGDIVVKFNNTNLHQINGYGIKKKSVL